MGNLTLVKVGTGMYEVTGFDARPLSPYDNYREYPILYNPSLYVKDDALCVQYPPCEVTEFRIGDRVRMTQLVKLAIDIKTCTGVKLINRKAELSWHGS